MNRRRRWLFVGLGAMAVFDLSLLLQFLLLGRIVCFSSMSALQLLSVLVAKTNGAEAVILSAAAGVLSYLLPPLCLVLSYFEKKAFSLLFCVLLCVDLCVSLFLTFFQLGFLVSLLGDIFLLGIELKMYYTKRED